LLVEGIQDEKQRRCFGNSPVDIMKGL
jgi:hypothetical protein